MDATDFRHIVMPHYRPMYRLAYAILGNSDDAQDAVQEAVAKLWHKRDALPDESKALSYCLTTVRNCCADMLRMRRHVPITDDLREMCPDDMTDLSQTIESRDTLNKVIDLAATLPEAQQEVLRLRSYGDYSLQEIAEITGTSYENARTLLSRARRRLKELYSKLR